MIEVESLSMHYGATQVLDHISFQVSQGEIVGLLGPNGAGKTTTMRILTTFLYPTAGTVKIQGFNVIEQPLEVRKCVGYLPETAPLYPEMNVEGYLKFVGKARGLLGKQLEERLEYVREMCYLKGMWKHLIAEISKGYRQRVGLAQALIHDPPVLILDEPTSGLDPVQILEIRELIKNFTEKKAILFSTHILQEVDAIADRIVILNEGKVLAQGTQEELASDQKGAKNIEDIFMGVLKKEPTQLS